MFKDMVSASLSDFSSLDEVSAVFAAEISLLKKEPYLTLELFRKFPSLEIWTVPKLMPFFLQHRYRADRATLKQLRAGFITDLVKTLTIDDSTQRDLAEYRCAFVASILENLPSGADPEMIAPVFSADFTHLFLDFAPDRVWLLHEVALSVGFKEQWVSNLLTDLRPKSFTGRTIIDFFFSFSDKTITEDVRLWSQLSFEDLKVLPQEVSTRFLVLSARELSDVSSREVFASLVDGWAGDLWGLLDTCKEVLR